MVTNAPDGGIAYVGSGTTKDDDDTTHNSKVLVVALLKSLKLWH